MRAFFLALLAIVVSLWGSVAAMASDGINSVVLPRSLATRVIQSGHSLTDPIPPVLEGIIRAAGGPNVNIARSTVPGSTMEYRWLKKPGYPDPDARSAIGDYAVLVLTERVSLPGPMEYHNSKGEALRWFNHAWQNGDAGRGAETILYATWVDIKGDQKDPEGHLSWRERLLLESRRWMQILDYVNSNRAQGTPPMRLIPGTLIFLDVYDQIAAGTAPGLNDISDLFSDDIHLNDAGSYLIALAHYAVIYGRDPRGLPNKVGLTTPPSSEIAAWMQDLVWRIVTTTKGTGIKAAQ